MAVMQQCGMWYKCKMIKMWIQILAQMASLFNSCTHANSSRAFFITLSFGYCTLCLDIEYDALILCRLVVEFVLIFLAGVRDRSISVHM